MKTINYKCRNCGATVKPGHNKSSLTCAYCNTTYVNFVKLEDVSVDNLVEKLQIHSYKCCFCGSSFNSEKKVDKPVCPGCNSFNLEESNLIVNGVVLNELVEKYIINDFKNELVGIEKYIPNEFFTNDFSLKYIKSKIQQ